MCNLITHSLAFYQSFNTKSKTSEKFKIQCLRSVEPFSQSIKKMKKFITKPLPCSIDSRFLFDQLKRTFDRSKGILDRSRQ